MLSNPLSIEMTSDDEHVPFSYFSPTSQSSLGSLHGFTEHILDETSVARNKKIENEMKVNCIKWCQSYNRKPFSGRYLGLRLSYRLI